MHGKRLFQGAAGVGILAILLWLTACSNAEASSVATPTPEIIVTSSILEDSDKTLNLLYWQSPQTLNPHLGSANKDWQVARIVYEPLASFNEDGDLIPFLAAEVPTIENGGLDPDGRFVIWKLRDDVVWSDGEPFTADDVRFTFEYITNDDVKSPSKNIYTPLISSVEVLDDHTVQINFTEPNLTSWVTPFVGLRGMILPEHIFADYLGANAADAPIDLAVGTGPYQVVSYRPEETLFLGNELIQTVRVLFAPNESFREGRPFFDKVILRGGSTLGEAALQVLQTDEADYAWNIQLTPDELARLSNSTIGSITPSFGGRVERLLFNLSDPYTEVNGEYSSKDSSNPLLSDIRVREAIALSIDRQSIANLYGPTGQTTSNILVAPANYDSPNTSFRYDPEAAKALLDEAGWIDSDGDGIRDKDGVSLELLGQTSNTAIRIAGMQIIQDNLADVGVHMDLKLVDASNFSAPNRPDSIWQFQADLLELFTGTASPEPTAYMQRWTAQQIPQMADGWTAGWNLERWQNEEYEALFTQLNSTSDPVERERLFIAMNDLLVNDYATVPLVKIAQAAAFGNDILGVDLTPWDADTWNIKDWERLP